jgi:hypothetical protein
VNRRGFLGLLGSLPLLRWLRPKLAEVEANPSIWCGPLSQQELELWEPAPLVPYGVGLEVPTYPIPDFSNPWPKEPPTRDDYYHRFKR